MSLTMTIRTVEELLSFAKTHLEMHNKHLNWVEPAELDALVKSGAVLVRKDHQDEAGDYLHEVKYKEYTFIAATKKPYSTQDHGN